MWNTSNGTELKLLCAVVLPNRKVHEALDKNYPFKHYAVFDLEYGQEQQQEEG